jgi:hypothetical protein
MCGSEGGGSLGVPRRETGGGIEGIGHVPEQWAPTDKFVRQRWAAKEPSGPRIKPALPDCGGFFSAGDQLAHAVRRRANTDEKQFGQRGESFVIWAFRTRHWICLLVSVLADRAAIGKSWSFLLTRSGVLWTVKCGCGAPPPKFRYKRLTKREHIPLSER